MDLLLLRVLAPVALDLDDEMQRVVRAVAVVHQHDEVGQILPRLGAVAIRNLETEVVVLGVGDSPCGCDSATRQNSASQSLSSTTQLTWFFGGGPVVSQRSARDVLNRTWRGAGGVIRIEQRLDRTLAEERAGDGRGDPVAGHVGQLLIHELRRIRVALADETGVEPLLGDALELAEEVQLRLLAGVAPLRVEQPLREVEDERGRPHVARCSRSSRHLRR